MKIFVAIGGLVVLLLSAVLVAPLVIDWTAYRTAFEGEASRILGEPVRVLGEAEARLLPFPSLTFTDVVVGASDARPVMTLARFRMDAELAPYLSGEIRIFQMSLDAPHLNVEIGAEGGEGGLPALPGAAGSTVVLENVAVTDGRISLINPETGRSREFTGIEAAIAAGTLSGPFSGSGRLEASGEPLSFSLSSGRIEESGRWPLRLTLGSDRLGGDATFDGATVFGDGEPDFAGRLDLSSRPAPEGEVAPLPPIRLGSLVEIGRREARLSEIRAEIGPAQEPYVLTGEGTFSIADLPHFSLALRGEQVNVDELAGRGEAAAGAGALTFAERAEAVRATLTAIPRIDIPGRVELSLPIVTAGDTTIRDFAFAGSPSDAGWTIRSLRAEFPGRTLIEASGLLDIRERFAFSGDVLLAARQPSLLATWLTGEIAPEIAGLTRAGFSAKVDLSAERQVMSDLEVDVGGQSLLGSLSRDEDNALSADITGGAVDLDAFLAFARLFTDGTDALQPPAALDVRFEAGPVAFDGLEADTVSLDFSYADAFLDLRNLILEGVAGSDIEARGFVAGTGAEATPEIALDLRSQAPDRLAAALAERWPEFAPPIPPGRLAALAPLSLYATASSPAQGLPSAVALEMSGTAGETAVEMSATADRGLAAFAEGGGYRVEAELRSDDPAALLRQLGGEGLDLGLAAPLSISANAVGEGGGEAELQAEARAPGSTLSLAGTIRPDRSAPTGTLAIRAASDDAAPWLTAAGVALGQGFDGLPLALTADLAVAERRWSLAAIEGEVAGTSMEGSLAASAGELEGTVRLGELSLPWLATLVYGVPPDLEAEDGGLWPDRPFTAPFLGSRALALGVAAERLDLGGGRSLSDLSAQLDLADGRLRVSQFEAGLAGGRLSGNGEMANVGGFGSLRADLALRDARLDGTAVPIEGALSGQLALEGSGRSFAEIAGSLTGQGEAQLAGAALEGVAPDRLPAILAAAYAEGFEVEADGVAALVRAADRDAAYGIGALDVPLALSVGVARALPVTVERAGETLTASGSLDLRTLASAATATLAFRPGEDDRIEEAAPSITYELSDGSWELAGVEPLTSFLSLRAYRREQERLLAIREELRETIRLRREARLYRAREAERAAALEAERQRLEAEETARREAAEAEAARAAEQAAAERAAAQEARRIEEAARRAAAEAAAPVPQPAPPAPAAPPFQFELPAPAAPAAPAPQGYGGLPGVQPLPSL